VVGILSVSHDQNQLQQRLLQLLQQRRTLLTPHLLLPHHKTQINAKIPAHTKSSHQAQPFCQLNTNTSFAVTTNCNAW
jgi:hypothetical protein